MNDRTRMWISSLRKPSFSYISPKKNKDRKEPTCLPLSWKACFLLFFAFSEYCFQDSDTITHSWTVVVCVCVWGGANVFLWGGGEKVWCQQIQTWGVWWREYERLVYLTMGKSLCTPPPSTQASNPLISHGCPSLFRHNWNLWQHLLLDSQADFRFAPLGLVGLIFLHIYFFWCITCTFRES